MLINDDQHSIKFDYHGLTHGLDRVPGGRYLHNKMIGIPPPLAPFDIKSKYLYPMDQYK